MIKVSTLDLFLDSKSKYGIRCPDRNLDPHVRLMTQLLLKTAILTTCACFRERRYLLTHVQKSVINLKILQIYVMKFSTTKTLSVTFEMMA